MSIFTPEEIERNLKALGVPHEKAQAQAFGMPILVSTDMPRNTIGFAQGGKIVAVITNLETPAIAWPVRLLLPWSHLVSDNDKDTARLITRNGEPKPIKVITREYAGAKEKIANLAKGKVGDAAAHAGPIAIAAKVWVPDERPHDIANFCKLVHDALEGVVYDNDRWLYDVHWIRAGVDVDAPRAEITIQPLGA